jgi:monoterpene epsilon-lactone hydrolase
MASDEYRAFQERMAANPPPPPPGSLQELRDRVDANMSQIPLAEGASAKEVDANGVRAILCESDAAPAAGPVLVYFHGGGYRMGSAIAWRSYGSHLAVAIAGRVLLVDYRLAPEDPFPAAIDDAVAAYRWVIDQGPSGPSEREGQGPSGPSEREGQGPSGPPERGGLGVPPTRTVVGGDSAGGGIAAALPLRLRDDGLPLPAGMVCLSPWVDHTNSAASYERNTESDKLFSKTSATEATALYLGDQDPTHPHASPVFGAWSGMPPLLIQVGDGEVLVDDAAELASVAAAAGVDVEHHVYADMPHVWQLSYPAFPEAVDAVAQIADFVRRVTAR